MVAVAASLVNQVNGHTAGATILPFHRIWHRFSRYIMSPTSGTYVLVALSGYMLLWRPASLTSRSFWRRSFSWIEGWIDSLCWGGNEPGSCQRGSKWDHSISLSCEANNFQTLFLMSISHVCLLFLSEEVLLQASSQGNGGTQ